MITFVLVALSLALAGRAGLMLAKDSRAWLSGQLRRIGKSRIPGRVQGRSIGDLAESLGTRSRLRRGGLEDRLPLPTFIAAKSLGGLAGFIGAFAVLGAGPPRVFAVAALALPLAGFLLPDAVVETIARRRMDSVSRSLAGALEVAASAVGGGRDPLTALVSGAGEGSVLARELGAALAETGCGITRRGALESLTQRVPTAEVSSLAATLDRSARFGSPLADGFRQQAEALRRTQRRRIAEGAARASPRIQLVVALVLVPSVLLMVAAGILANLDSIV